MPISGTQKFHGCDGPFAGAWNGANTAIFSVVNSVLLRELPFKDPDQLMSVSSRRTDRDDAPFTLPDFLDYRDQNRTLDHRSTELGVLLISQDVCLPDGLN